MPDASGHSCLQLRLEAGMKSTRVTTSGQLPEHSAGKPELSLDNEVQKVVWHPRIVTGCRIHFDIGKWRSLRLYRVPSVTDASKENYHPRLQFVLTNTAVRGRGFQLTCCEFSLTVILAGVRKERRCCGYAVWASY
jgi:hypothetical protein